MGAKGRGRHSSRAKRSLREEQELTVFATSTGKLQSKMC